MAESFAKIWDLEARWRPLQASEVQRADVLLSDASAKVRRRFPTVDARITAGDLEAQEVAAVVAGMVRRAMTQPAEGVLSVSQGAGPFSQTQQYANPNGNLYLTAEDVRTLNDPTYGRRAFSVDLTPGP